MIVVLVEVLERTIAFHAITVLYRVLFNAVLLMGACHYLTNRFQTKTPRAPREAFKKAPRSLRGDGEAFEKASRRLLGLFSKPSAPATSSRSAREDVANPSRRCHGKPIA